MAMLKLSSWRLDQRYTHSEVHTLRDCMALSAVGTTDQDVALSGETSAAKLDYFMMGPHTNVTILSERLLMPLMPPSLKQPGHHTAYECNMLIRDGHIHWANPHNFIAKKRPKWLSERVNAFLRS